MLSQQSDRFVLSQWQYYGSMLGYRGHGKEVVAGSYRTYTDECTKRGLIHAPAPCYKVVLTDKGSALNEKT